MQKIKDFESFAAGYFTALRIKHPTENDIRNYCIESRTFAPPPLTTAPRSGMLLPSTPQWCDTGLASRMHRRSAATSRVAAFLLADRKGEALSAHPTKGSNPQLPPLQVSELREGLQAPSGGWFLCTGTPTCKSAHL